MKRWYCHREDRLETRVEEVGSGLIHERFGPGREKALKTHTYSTIHSHTRTMAFYHRSVGLEQRARS